MKLPSSIALWLVLAGPAPPPRAAPFADRRHEAASAFAAGEVAFSRGDYETAAGHFGYAHALVPHPHTLYNLGLAQELGGDLVGAWTSFRRLEQAAPTAAERTEATARRQRLQARVAVLRVEGRPERRICLDARPIARVGESSFEVATRGGAHELVIDGERSDLVLAEGELRVVDRTDGRPAPRGVIALAGIATGASALAVGLGAGALAVRSDARTGLGLASVGAAAVATATGIAALGLHVRPRPGRRARREHACPPHPEL